MHHTTYEYYISPFNSKKKKKVTTRLSPDPEWLQFLASSQELQK